MPTILVTLENTSELPQDVFDDLVAEIYDRIVDRTPIDTGLCQASWQLVKVDKDTYELYNDTEYVSYLEEGWSQQAPDGMVEVTLAEIPEIMSNIF